MGEEPELVEATVVQPTRSRRGATLPVRKVVLTFEDGTEETWEFPGEPAYFRENKNRQTKPEAVWDTFQVWWTSNKYVEAPKHVEPGTPILDAHGRATGRVT